MMPGDEQPKKRRQAVFCCWKCKAEHRPKSLDWTDQSVEVWRLGWKLVLVEAKTGSGYSLHCAKCAKEALAAAA